MIFLIIGGFIMWGIVFYNLDRPSVPAWKVRDYYRVTSIILFTILLLVFYKALAYHAELVMMLKICR